MRTACAARGASVNQAEETLSDARHAMRSCSHARRPSAISRVDTSQQPGGREQYADARSGDQGPERDFAQRAATRRAQTAGRAIDSRPRWFVTGWTLSATD